MVVTEIRTRTVDGWNELSGLVIADKSRRCRRIWWRVPETMPGPAGQNGDPFIAALLPLALQLGERLKIEGPVSPKLLQAADAIQSIYCEWLPGKERIPIEADLKSDGRQGDAVGCFFSGGVDSFYSLLKNDVLPEGDPDRLTHLIFVVGFDLPLSENRLVRQVRAHLNRVATHSGRRYLEVRTNLREISDSILNWGFYHGAAMASVGLLCGSVFRRILIPSSFAHEQLHPWGSHPRLDPLWSTEHTEFIHDGCEAVRSEKITDWIARSDLALENLRVCWKNYWGRYNCSVCEKCVRTMISLHAGTGDVQFPTFRRPLTARRIRRLKLDDETRLVFAKENLALLRSRSGCNPNFVEALNKAILQGKSRKKPSS